jgi:hypothetical protein
LPSGAEGINSARDDGFLLVFVTQTSSQNDFVISIPLLWQVFLTAFSCYNSVLLPQQMIITKAKTGYAGEVVKMFVSGFAVESIVVSINIE